MHGGSAQRTQHLGPRPTRPDAARAQRRSAPRRVGAPASHDNITVARREARRVSKTNVYRRRRMVAVLAITLGFVALVLAVLVQSSEARGRALPIDPNNAGPDAVLGTVAGVGISTPVRPEDKTGRGYHHAGGG